MKMGVSEKRFWFWGFWVKIGGTPILGNAHIDTPSICFRKSLNTEGFCDNDEGVSLAGSPVGG